MYFTSDHVDLISDVQIFREEKWKEASAEDRLQALREYETRVSNFEKRPTWKVDSKDFGNSKNEGGCNDKTKTISIDKEVVEGDSSYKALLIMAEESHHAFQFHALANPGFYEGSEMAGWRENFKPEKYCDCTHKVSKLLILCFQNRLLTICFQKSAYFFSQSR